MRIPGSALIAGVATLALLAGCGEDLLGELGLAQPVSGDRPAPPSEPILSPEQQIEQQIAEDGLTLSEISPTRGNVAGGDQITISGTSFLDGMEVMFGETPAQMTVVSSLDRIVAITPPRPAGTVDVRVIDPYTGQSAVLEAAFTFKDPMQLTAVEPAAGHLYGGEHVTVYGAGFEADTFVLFGSRPAASVEVIDQWTIEAISPDAATEGLVDVHVAGEAGSASLRDAFFYYRSPSVALVDPAAGPFDEAVSIHVSGQGLYDPILAWADGEPLAAISPDGDGLGFTALVPPGVSPGAVELIVATAFGTTTASGAYTRLAYLDGDELEVMAVYPDAGPVDGGAHVTVAVAGTTSAGGGANVEVSFGGAPATILNNAISEGWVLVRTPAADLPGLADVTLRVDDRSATRPDGYRFRQVPRIYEILPNFGPAAGGETVVITGRGFAANAQVWIGALPAADVQIIDETKIVAVTPPGSPGLALVRVEQDGEVDELVGGYLYQGDQMAVWVVDPPLGAIGGGTLIEILGSAFPSDLEVTFGGVPASEVVRVDSSRLRVKSPRAELVGPVDVRVTANLAGLNTQASMGGGFTYYNPANSIGGVWGPPIDRNVYVTVLDWNTRIPVPGATVALGRDADVPRLQLAADDRGQRTFGAWDLEGPLTVSASMPGYGSFTIFETDGINVTLLIQPIPECPDPASIDPEDCEPDECAPSMVTGQVTFTDKGPTPYFKPCTDYEGLYPELCTACSDDAQCGSSQCVAMPGQEGSFCTPGCASDAECPFDLMCVPEAGGGKACIPPPDSGQLYCNTSIPSINDPGDVPPYPGIEVGGDGKFSLGLAPGIQTIYCWRGLWRQGQFRPWLMGVARDVVISECGQSLEVDVPLLHSVDYDLEAQIDAPDVDAGIELRTVRTFLDLGDEGFIEFLTDTATDFDSATSTVVWPLSGDLADTEYIFDVSWRDLADPNGQSYHLEDDVSELDNDTVWRADAPTPGLAAQTWEDWSIDTTEAIRAIAGLPSGEGTLFVGDNGAIVRTVGSGWWAVQDSGTDKNLLAVSVAPDGSAMAVGEQGTIVAWDGAQWTPVFGPNITPMTGVHLAAADAAWVVEGQNVWHHDGATWTLVHEAPVALSDVTGGPDGAVWVTGAEGYLATSEDGAPGGWSAIDAATVEPLSAVWVDVTGAVFAVGEHGVIVRRDGDGAVTTEVVGDSDLRGVWGRTADIVFAVGQRGTILRFDGSEWQDETPLGYDATLEAIGGDPVATWAAGSHEVVLGPLVPSVGWDTSDEFDADFTLIYIPAAIFCEICDMPTPLPYVEWMGFIEGPSKDVDLAAYLQEHVQVAGLTPGYKNVWIYRVQLAGDFDIDHFDMQALSSGLWESYSTGVVSILVPTPLP